MEGLDTDNNDIFRDLDEINGTPTSITGFSDPVDSRDPARNRALKLNGTNDFLRTLDAWVINTPNHLTRFTVEAWVMSTNTVNPDEQIVLERTIILEHDETPLFDPQTHVNFRLGITGPGTFPLLSITAMGRARLCLLPWPRFPFP